MKSKSNNQLHNTTSLKNKKAVTLPVIVIIAVILIGVVVGGYFIFKKPKGPGPGPLPAPNIETTPAQAVDKIIEACVESPMLYSDYLPYVNNDISLCQNHSNPAKCEFNFYIFKGFENSFADCNSLEEENAKKFCEAVRGGAASCDILSYGDTPVFVCKAIAQNNVDACDSETDSSYLKVCRDMYYSYIALSQNKAEECEKTEEFDRDFGIQRGVCYLLATKNLSFFKEIVTKKCKEDVLVGTLNKSSCSFIGAENDKKICEEKIDKIIQCSNKLFASAENKKSCISEIIHLKMICGHVGMGPALGPEKENILKKVPGLCSDYVQGNY